MKVAVTDACIFIDLLDCEACAAFFELEFDIITTRQVWMELEEEQRDFLEQWTDSGQLRVIKSVKNVLDVKRDHKMSEALSIADLSVWALTSKEDGILLTSDGTLRKAAQAHNLETHGLLWVFDQLVVKELLSVEEATNKLKLIFNQNIYYKSDHKLYHAFESLLTGWKK